MDDVNYFFTKEAPQWARDPFNGDATQKCGLCGGWESVVRPGKTQCDNPVCPPSIYDLSDQISTLKAENKALQEIIELGIFHCKDASGMEEWLAKALALMFEIDEASDPVLKGQADG